MERIIHVCDTCSTEIDGEFCVEHPDATVSSVIVKRAHPVTEEDEIKRQRADRRRNAPWRGPYRATRRGR